MVGSFVWNFFNKQTTLFKKGKICHAVDADGQ